MTTADRLYLLPHTVYRVYNERDGLLYIGCTHDITDRMRTHAKRAPWFWRMDSLITEEFPDMKSARLAEYLAIADEAPLYNVLGTWSRTQRPEPPPVTSTAEGMAHAARAVQALGTA